MMGTERKLFYAESVAFFDLLLYDLVGYMMKVIDEKYVFDEVFQSRKGFDDNTQALKYIGSLFCFPEVIVSR